MPDLHPIRFAPRARRLLIILAGLILIVILALWVWPREKAKDGRGG
jgi:hypothetical protein